jgi:glutamate-1-semialdehyde 2,1-aminomutase
MSVSPLVESYRRRTPGSAALAARAAESLPSGVTHDSWFLQPYPPFIARAQGSRKWDVDGNEYVDYAGGHGALLLGHGHPAVVAAVTEQVQRGTHYGTCHELQVHWAELVKRLIPSAEKVRFTASGTEATMMAVRLARAHTGRPKLLRFKGHFHGWNDHMAFGVTSNFDGTPTPGVLTELTEQVVQGDAGDVAGTATLLAKQDVAAIIVEPTGASWGQVPLDPSFLAALREETQKTGTVLIFDEVITGFRCSPGGAQAALGITPDLTTLAKIVAGGLPGGGLCGRRDLLDGLDFVHPTTPTKIKVPHNGTFNANPLTAAAGIAALTVVAETDACAKANDYAARLRDEIERLLHDLKSPWVVYGTYSGFHLFTNPERLPITRADVESCRYDYKLFKSAPRALNHKLRVGMLAHGVELFSWPGGPTSSVHTDDDLRLTVEALRRTVLALREEGENA